MLDADGVFSFLLSCETFLNMGVGRKDKEVVNPFMLKASGVTNCLDHSRVTMEKSHGQYLLKRKIHLNFQCVDFNALILKCL